MPKDHDDVKKDNALQDIERHSLCCSAKMGPMTMDRNRADDGPNDDTLRFKISKLCRHAEEFHKSQVTLGHDDTAFQYRPRSKDSTTHSLVMNTAEKTPTRLPRRSCLPSLARDDVVEVHGGEGENMTGTGRAPQDVVPYEKVKGVALKFSHYLAPLDHGGPESRPVPTASSSSSIKATDQPAESEEHQNQESALRPLPLTLRQKNLDAVDIDGKKSSSGKNGLDIDPVSGVDDHEGPPGRSINGMAVETSAENDLPSLTGYKRHRQDTYLCSKTQTPNPEPEPWPVLRKVGHSRKNEEVFAQPSAPWSRLPLRSVSSSVGCLDLLGEKVDSPISPRNKGDDRRECAGASHFTPSKIIPASTPISDWRCKLVKPADSAPNPPLKNVVCESCDLTESRRLVSPIDNTPEACSRRSNSLVRSVKDTYSNLEDADPFSEPRLSIRAIENSLAWKKVQDDLEKNIANGEGKNESASPRSSPTTASNKSAGRKAATIGCSQPCSWRSQYRTLRDEILMNDDLLTVCQGGFEWKGDNGPSRYEGSAVEELGIEALTVVVHMRHRDNLVINTDLTGKHKQEG
ncbi:hypothetical protein E4U21_006795 [Claviceps maximensis]|nr:hypothetical protein E4U21_006795 [Claviceps maximensis]